MITIQQLIATHSTLTTDDEHAITIIAEYITGFRDVPTDAERAEALNQACVAMAGYRKTLRRWEGKAIIDALPTRPAVAGDGANARYHWRVLFRRISDGSEYVSNPSSGDKYGNSGSIAGVKGYAMEIMIEGYAIPVELIPPDYDPTNKADVFQKNVSQMQPAGLTVRQREKKH